MRDLTIVNNKIAKEKYLKLMRGKEREIKIQLRTIETKVVLFQSPK